MAIYEIPLIPQAQSLTITLGASTYILTVEWNPVANRWQIHLSDSAGNRILSSIPLVAGVDLLGPFSYLNIGGSLVAASDDSLFVQPTYDNLGLTGRVYFLTA